MSNIAFMSGQITVNTERRGDILMSRRQNSRIRSSDETGRDHWPTCHSGTGGSGPTLLYYLRPPPCYCSPSPSLSISCERVSPCVRKCEQQIIIDNVSRAGASRPAWPSCRSAQPEHYYCPAPLTGVTRKYDLLGEQCKSRWILMGF